MTKYSNSNSHTSGHMADPKSENKDQSTQKLGRGEIIDW